MVNRIFVIYSIIDGGGGGGVRDVYLSEPHPLGVYAPLGNWLAFQVPKGWILAVAVLHGRVVLCMHDTITIHLP